jgi:hypothetical protein
MSHGRRQRAKGTKRERGVIMALAGVFLVAIIAISAISIEVSRLTDTATEVQVAADAAALAAAQNMLNGGDPGTATAAGQTVAGLNQTDGRLPQAPNVGIEFGTYGAGGFVPGAADNAVRATVAIPNVRFILATVFDFGASTTVTKRALAGYQCLGGNVVPTAPITIGLCQLATYTQGEPCSTNGTTLTVTPDTTQNACWTANPSDDNDWLPRECGGTNSISLSVGDPIVARNGNMTPIFRDIQACVGSQCVYPGETGPGIHDFVIPIIPCPIANCNNGTSIGQAVGFATMHISCPTDISIHGPGPDSITFTQICNNNAAGTGGNTGNGGSAPTCLGSGNARLIADR